MDIVSHGLAGFLVVRAASAPVRSAAAAAGLAGALGPDIDVVARLWDPLATISIHRVPTHSFLGGLVVAVVGGGLIRLIAGGRLWRLAGLAYLGLLSHLLLDSSTPFGTALLWPVDSRRWSLGSLHMVDLFVGLILVAGLIPPRWYHRSPAVVARAAVVALVAYLLLTVAVMKAVEARWSAVIAGQEESGVRAAVVPAFPGPFRWVGVAETPQAFQQSQFWVWAVGTSSGSRFAKTIDAPAPAVGDHPAVRMFLEFARFPWRQTVKDGEDWIVEYRDLAFADHPFGGPMVLRLRVDAAGAVRTVKLDHRL